ncbi:MAG: thiol peroxidase [Planctomycetes bacterium]|nr:thiol peroxidase [Planctomycetota bacterium]
MYAIACLIVCTIIFATASCAGAESSTPVRRTGVVSLRGAPLTLIGPAIRTGAPAPAAELRDANLAVADIAAGKGKVRIILTVPSLDTPTCAVETRTFNRRAVDLAKDVEVIVVSRDLPFAQKRFCAAEGIERVRTLSDYEDGSLGRAWGLYIEENALLARAAVILDRENIVRYVQIVPNLADEPDYDAVLKAAAEIAKT